MPKQRRARELDEWPENSDPFLERILKQDVLPRFPELDKDKFLVVFGATKHNTLAQVATWCLRKRGRIIHRYYLITVNTHQSDWEPEELAALMAHEAGHLVNDLQGNKPKTWEERELAATSQAIARGFINGYKQIFQRLCQTPCWEKEHTLPNGRRIIRIQGRNLGGLYCRAGPTIWGSGFLQVYCPFIDSTEAQLLRKAVWMQPVINVRGVCTLCKRSLKKKHAAFRCSSCAMLYHKDCLHSYLKREHLVCPSCRQSLATNPVG